MARKYAIYDTRKFHFVTFTVVNWIDVFIRDVYKNLFFDSLRYCQQHKGLEVGAYCVMTSHIHLILGVADGFHLSDAIRDCKSYTSRHIRKAIEESTTESRRAWLLSTFGWKGIQNKRNNDFQFWQQHSHPIELNSPDIIDRCLRYIHQNPVEAGFVGKAEDWLWSSAKSYMEGCEDRIELVYLV